MQLRVACPCAAFCAQLGVHVHRIARGWCTLGAIICRKKEAFISPAPLAVLSQSWISSRVILGSSLLGKPSMSPCI